MFVYYFILFFKDFIYLLETREGREKEREKNIRWSVASHMAPTGGPVHNPGMCPDWESKQ